MRLLVWLVLASGCLDKLVPYHAPASARVEDPVVDLAQPIPDDLAEQTFDLGSAPDLLVTSPADLATFSLKIEAELATLTAPMAAMPDANASGGAYIAVPAAGTGGKAVFDFSLPFDGSYAVWGRVLAPADANNSFHVSMDQDVIDNDPTDGLSTIWDLPIVTTWTLVRLNMRIDGAGTDVDRNLRLAAGPHKLYLNQREELTQLDQLIITSDLASPPN